MKRRIWIVALLPGLLFGAHVRAESLAVLTYNIHHGAGMDGKLDLDRIVRVIQSAHPAVVCLQEVDRNLPRTNHLDFPALLAEKLGMNVIFEPNYRFDGGEYGNALFTKLDVVSYANHALPNPKNAEPRGCLQVTVKVGGREVDFLDAHLGLDAEERTAQAEAILGWVRAAPTVLSGDMNEDVDGGGMRVLLKRFTDAVDKKSPGKRKQIDHILVSGGVRILSSRILDTPESRVASDHLPCLAVLESSPAAGDAGENSGKQ